jgi:hypothetical protein
MWTDCSLNATLARNGTECRFGTLNDQQTMAVISGSGYLIYFGCFAATLSSAIASLVGRSPSKNRYQLYKPVPIYVLISVSDPDRDSIRSVDPVPDPGGQK